MPIFCSFVTYDKLFKGTMIKLTSRPFCFSYTAWSKGKRSSVSATMHQQTLAHSSQNIALILISVGVFYKHTLSSVFFFILIKNLCPCTFAMPQSVRESHILWNSFPMALSHVSWHHVKSFKRRADWLRCRWNFCLCSGLWNWYCLPWVLGWKESLAGD